MVQSKADRIPSINDWEFASVPELCTLTVYSHAAKGCTTQVEVGAAIGAVPSGALVGYNDGHGPP